MDDGGIIRNNTLRDNGTRKLGLSPFWGANIPVRASSDTVVHDNTVIDTIGWHGAVVHGDGCGGEVRNVFVYDHTVRKTIRASTGKIAARIGRSLTPTARYDRNGYEAASGATWQDVSGIVDWNGWRAAGQGPNGILVLLP